MNPFQRYRAAPITPITFSGAAYHTWSCRFQLTFRLFPNRPSTLPSPGAYPLAPEREFPDS